MKSVISIQQNGTMNINGELIEYPAELVGGRNLLKNSQLIYSVSNNNSTYPINAALLSEDGKDYIRVSRRSPELSPNTMSLYNSIPISDITQELNEKVVTFSFRARASRKIESSLMLYVTGNGNPNTNLNTRDSRSFELDTKWQTFSWIVDFDVFTKNFSTLRFTPYHITIPNGEVASFYLDICDYKIEIGTGTNAPWSPAPEDLGLDYPDWVQSFGQPLGFQKEGVTTGELYEFPPELVGGRNLITLDSVVRSSATVSGYKYTLTRSGSGNPYIRIPYNLFENDTEYAITFKVKKVSGTLFSMAGHVENITNTGTTTILRDGVVINDGVSWSSGDQNYPNDTNEHHYEIRFRSGKNVSSGTTPHWYIQPNRSAYGQDYKLEIWDWKLEKGNIATSWTPAPEDLGLTYPSWIQSFGGSYNGGTNLVQGTQTNDYIAYGSSRVIITDNDGVKTVKAECTTNGTFGLTQGVTNRKMNLVQGERYTISFDIRGNIPIINYLYIMNLPSPNQSIAFVNVSSATEFTRVSSTFTTAYSVPFSYPMISAQGGIANSSWFEVKNIKIEKGNSATPYLQAPEDIERVYPEVLNTPLSIDSDEFLVKEISEYPDIIEDGLVLWYDFMGITNTDRDKDIATDLSGNGNDGELINFSYQLGSGYEGDGLQFDGVDDRINAGNKEVFNISDALTIEMIIRPYTAGKIGGFVKGTAGGWSSNSYGLRLSNTGSLEYNFYITDGNTVHQLLSTPLPLDKWTHIVGVTSKELGRLQVYLNGKLVNAMTRSIGNIKVTNSDLELGTAYSGSYSDANFKSARLYNRALTSVEIAHNYEVEKARWGL